MGADQRANEQRMAMERQNFAAALSAGARNAQPIDRVGVAIKKDMIVMYRPPQDIFFRVLDVKPVLDPRYPPGLVNVIVGVEFPITLRAGQPQPNMIVIGGPRPDGSPTATEPPADDPGRVLEGDFGAPRSEPPAAAPSTD